MSFVNFIIGRKKKEKGCCVSSESFTALGNGLDIHFRTPTKKAPLKRGVPAHSNLNRIKGSSHTGRKTSGNRPYFCMQCALKFKRGQQITYTHRPEDRASVSPEECQHRASGSSSKLMEPWRSPCQKFVSSPMCLKSRYVIHGIERSE